MIVRTTRVIAKPPAALWPLLCSSRMDGTPVCRLGLGIPTPLACRLASGRGGLGARRQCISDQGLTEQRITVWEPERALAFRMERTGAAYGRLLQAMEDRFDLVAVAAGTRITRTTVFQVRAGPCPWGRAAVIAMGLKRVHVHVFANWSRS